MLKCSECCQIYSYKTVIFRQVLMLNAFADNNGNIQATTPYLQGGQVITTGQVIISSAQCVKSQHHP